MNGEIKIDKETLKAMMALLRFIENEYRFTPEYRQKPLAFKQTVTAFRKYVQEESLTSPVITQCHCKTPISNREIIFNVCLTCQGVVSEDFLAENS